jgi:hypothetical protein
VPYHSPSISSHTAAICLPLLWATKKVCLFESSPSNPVLPYRSTLKFSIFYQKVMPNHVFGLILIFRDHPGSALSFSRPSVLVYHSETVRATSTNANPIFFPILAFTSHPCTFALLFGWGLVCKTITHHVYLHIWAYGGYPSSLPSYILYFTVLKAIPVIKFSLIRASLTVTIGN